VTENKELDIPATALHIFTKRRDMLLYNQQRLEKLETASMENKIMVSMAPWKKTIQSLAPTHRQHKDVLRHEPAACLKVQARVYLLQPWKVLDAKNKLVTLLPRGSTGEIVSICQDGDSKARMP